MAQLAIHSDSYVLFELAGTYYGLPSQRVQQMEMVEHVTPVPNAADYVEGVVFVRGQVVPAINLRRRFGFADAPHTLRTRMVIVAHGGRSVGLIVDSAREFVTISLEAIQPLPETLAGMSGRYLQGIATMDKRLIMIVNVEELLKIEDPSTPA